MSHPKNLTVKLVRQGIFPTAMMKLGFYRFMLNNCDIKQHV